MSAILPDGQPRKRQVGDLTLAGRPPLPACDRRACRSTQLKLQRWRVTDTPTRIRHSLWSVPLEAPRPLYDWRFQGADETGDSYVFDVFKGEEGWHVHHTYA